MQIKLLTVLKRAGKPIELKVTGVSMNPVLYEDDTVTIFSGNSDSIYDTGDILVFVYNRSELLIHRLIEIKDGLLYCKGDNALRMEKITADRIIGKVTGIRRNGQNIPLPPCTDKLIIMAKAVNAMFFKRRYDPVKTRETYIYKIYNRIFIDGEDINMYIRNDKMDYIDTDGSSAAVFDPESGDTHFLDEAGADIIKILEQPHDMDAVIDEICEIYDGERGEIAGDVREFIDDAVKKGIIVEL